MNPMGKIKHYVVNGYDFKLLEISTWGLQMHLLNVMGNIYCILNIVPRIIANPQDCRVAEYL